MSGLPVWTRRVVPAHARLALAIVVAGVVLSVVALELPHGSLSNVVLNIGSLAVGVGVLLGAERAFRLRSPRR